MFSGHFGVAAGIKALDVLFPGKGQTKPSALEESRHETPLWALMLSTQLLDVVFAILLIPGVESFGGATGYGQGWIHAYYSHSLAGALIIATVAGALAGLRWGRRSGFIIGGTVMSHWLLDLIVHRPDLPWLPGNLGNLPFMGFGLWNYPVVSMVLEGILVAGGGALYLASTFARTTGARQAMRGSAWASSAVMAVLLALSLVASVLGVG